MVFLRFCIDLPCRTWYFDTFLLKMCRLHNRSFALLCIHLAHSAQCLKSQQTSCAPLATDLFRPPCIRLGICPNGTHRTVLSQSSRHCGLPPRLTSVPQAWRSSILSPSYPRSFVFFLFFHPISSSHLNPFIGSIVSYSPVFAVLMFDAVESNQLHSNAPLLFHNERRLIWQTQ